MIGPNSAEVAPISAEVAPISAEVRKWALVELAPSEADNPGESWPADTPPN